ncbi:MAG: 4-hydroxythreonine-4-phosphate dehydrogenase PdxA [Pseudomonadota bacterium]
MPPSSRKNPGILAVTMGDPAGIGGELSLKAWLAAADQHDHADSIGPFMVFDHPKRLADLASRLNLRVPIRAVADGEQAQASFAKALPVMPIAADDDAWHETMDAKQAAHQAILSIEQAHQSCQAGQCIGLVTNPVHKARLYAAGFAFPGHTEYLAQLCGAARAVMMLASPALRTVPVTVHVSLKAAIAALSADLIVETAHIVIRDLQDWFNISRPRLAIAGLNPHAGEEGSLGGQEQSIIEPAIRRLQYDHGAHVFGPEPADSLFAAHRRSHFDAALCMYHDQALIPVKTLDFHHTVNVTLGLGMIRTSPDHGTAFDIAGRGLADPASFCTALRYARMMATNARA